MPTPTSLSRVLRRPVLEHLPTKQTQAGVAVTLSFSRPVFSAVEILLFGAMSHGCIVMLPACPSGAFPSLESTLDTSLSRANQDIETCIHRKNIIV